MHPQALQQQQNMYSSHSQQQGFIPQTQQPFIPQGQQLHNYANRPSKSFIDFNFKDSIFSSLPNKDSSMGYPQQQMSMYPPHSQYSGAPTNGLHFY